MLENEALETGVSSAFDAWMTIFNDVLELTAAVPPAFKLVVESVTRPDWLLINDVLGSFNACKTYDACKNIIDRDHETLYVLCLLASWGAFESFVEETSKAALRAQPELLSNPAFERVTRRVAELDLTEDERRGRMIDNVVNGQRGKLDDDGNGKYEEQLGLADLDGPVPPDLARALMEAQQVRNVWAHHSGRADAKLIEEAPGLGDDIGQLVKITKLMLAKYVLAQNTYATIILNRFRSKHGLPAIECYGGEANIFKAAFDSIFPDAVSAHVIQERLNAERQSGNG
jgi:hypothetical protein